MIYCEAIYVLVGAIPPSVQYGFKDSLYWNFNVQNVLAWYYLLQFFLGT